MDSPPSLAGADRQQSLNLQRLPPIPGQRAQEQVDVLGRPDNERRRHVGGVGGGGQATAAVAPTAIDHTRRAEQHQEGQCIDDRKGGIAGCSAGQRKHEAEQGSAKRAGPGHTKQVIDSGKTPELPRQPERQSRQQEGRRSGHREPPRMQPITRGIRHSPRKRHSESRQNPSMAIFRATRTGGPAAMRSL